MNHVDRPDRQESSPRTDESRRPWRLWVRARLAASATGAPDRPGPEICRGMMVRASEAGDLVDVGVVAAILVRAGCPLGSHFLLGRVPPEASYRLVPAGLVAAVHEAAVVLAASHAAIARLPIFDPESDPFVENEKENAR